MLRRSCHHYFLSLPWRSRWCLLAAIVVVVRLCTWCGCSRWPCPDPWCLPLPLPLWWCPFSVLLPCLQKLRKGYKLVFCGEWRAKIFLIYFLLFYRFQISTSTTEIQLLKKYRIEQGIMSLMSFGLELCFVFWLIPISLMNSVDLFLVSSNMFIVSFRVDSTDRVERVSV